jgi:drug/metabolite transporter (DMT)-like permease
MRILACKSSNSRQINATGGAPKLNRFYTGVFLVFLSATGFGFMPILATYAYAGGANVATVLFLRFGVASLFLFLYLWLKKGLKVTISKKQWLALFLYGGVIYALISTFYFSSLHYIPGPLTALLLYTSPIFVVILNLVIEKEVFSKKVIFSILLCIAGLGMVLGTSFHTINFYGVFLATAAAVGYAIHIVLMNRMVKDLPPFVTSAFVILFTAVSLFVIGLTTHTLDFHFDSAALASIVGLSFASTILALLTFFAGMQLIGSTNASILSMLEPVVTIVLSTAILGQSLTGLQLIGSAAVLFGAAIVVKGQGQGNKELQEISG